MMTTDATITILDPEGREWPLVWVSELVRCCNTGPDWWCDFCDKVLTEGWVYNGDRRFQRTLVLCEMCAATQEQV